MYCGGVTDSPSCRTGGVSVVGAARGESVVIVCEVDADPPAAVFKWKFNNSGETLDVAADRYTSNGSASSLKSVIDLAYILRVLANKVFVPHLITVLYVTGTRQSRT